MSNTLDDLLDACQRADAGETLDASIYLEAVVMQLDGRQGVSVLGDHFDSIYGAEVEEIFTLICEHAMWRQLLTRRHTDLIAGAESLFDESSDRNDIARALKTLGEQLHTRHQAGKLLIDADAANTFPILRPPRSGVSANVDAVLARRLHVSALTFTELAELADHVSTLSYNPCIADAHHVANNNVARLGVRQWATLYVSGTANVFDIADTIINHPQGTHVVAALYSSDNLNPIAGDVLAVLCRTDEGLDHVSHLVAARHLNPRWRNPEHTDTQHSTHVRLRATWHGSIAELDTVVDNLSGPRDPAATH